MAMVAHHDTAEADRTASSDPVNGLLDLFEAQVQLLLDCGAEGPLRMRFKRLLPEPAATAAAPVTASPAPDADGELELLAVIAACKHAAKLKMPALAHAGIARIRDRAETDLATLKTERTAA